VRRKKEGKNRHIDSLEEGRGEIGHRQKAKLGVSAYGRKRTRGGGSDAIKGKSRKFGGNVEAGPICTGKSGGTSNRKKKHRGMKKVQAIDGKRG